MPAGPGGPPAIPRRFPLISPGGTVALAVKTVYIRASAGERGLPGQVQVQPGAQGGGPRQLSRLSGKKEHAGLALKEPCLVRTSPGPVL